MLVLPAALAFQVHDDVVNTLFPSSLHLPILSTYYVNMTKAAPLGEMPNPRPNRYRLRSSKQTLLNLSAEIRVKIYGYVFDKVAITYLSPRPEEPQNQPGECGYELLLVSKACYSEAKEIYFRQVELEIEDWSPSSEVSFTAAQIEHVQKVTIYINRYCCYIPPAVIGTLRNLKKVTLALPWKYVFSTADKLKPTDQGLIKDFGWWFQNLFSAVNAQTLQAMLPEKVEIVLPVTFKHKCCHGMKIVSVTAIKP